MYIRSHFAFRIISKVIREIHERLSPEWVRLSRQLHRHKALYGHPNVIVVGAAGGLGPRYSTLVCRSMVRAAGFEPEEEAYRRLVARSSDFSWYPFALGDEISSKTFYVTANPRCSSCLEPNMDILSSYSVADWFVVRSTKKIQLQRYDRLYEEGRVKFIPDFMHIDVQGYEFQVMNGLGKYIDDVTCIEAEAQLKPLYHKQKLFTDLKEYLEEKGFFLRSLEVQGYFEGEAIELNTYFVRWDRDLDDRRKSLVSLWEKICKLETRPLLPKKHV